MIDLTKISKEVYENTVRLGYSIDKDKTIDKMCVELLEFQVAEKLESDVISARISNIEDDQEFKREYESKIKGSEQDEIPDLIKVLMSYCVSVDIDLETCFMNKLRYNRLRDKK